MLSSEHWGATDGSEQERDKIKPAFLMDSYSHLAQGILVLPSKLFSGPSTLPTGPITALIQATSTFGGPPPQPLCLFSTVSLNRLVPPSLSRSTHSIHRAAKGPVGKCKSDFSLFWLEMCQSHPPPIENKTSKLAYAQWAPGCLSYHTPLRGRLQTHSVSRTHHVLVHLRSFSCS